MEERVEGLIIETYANLAKVKLIKHKECSLCGSCQGENAIVICVDNSFGADLGKLVLVEMKKSNELKAVFILFGLPILAIFFGIIIGEFLSNYLLLNLNLIDVFTCCIFFVISLVVIILYEKSIYGKSKSLVRGKVCSYLE